MNTRTYMTPGDFARVRHVKHECAGFGLGEMLMAAFHRGMRDRDVDFMNRFHQGWPYTDELILFSGFYFEAGHIIADDFKLPPLLYVVLAALRADSENSRRIEKGWPGLMEEVTVRYNTDENLVLGEEVILGGQRYVCTGEVTPGEYSWNVRTQLIKFEEAYNVRI